MFSKGCIPKVASEPLAARRQQSDGAKLQIIGHAGAAEFAQFARFEEALQEDAAIVLEHHQVVLVAHHICRDCSRYVYLKRK
jgi:L-alanine-DL-glutamate epimerase-like enolase superfamily enzyme